MIENIYIVFFSSRRRHTRFTCDWSSDVCSSDLIFKPIQPEILRSKVSVFVELFRKGEALKRQAHELARLSRQNQLILNAVAEGVFGVDKIGRASCRGREKNK